MFKSPRREGVGVFLDFVLQLHLMPQRDTENFELAVEIIGRTSQLADFGY